MKKAYIFLLCLVLIAGIFSGCNKSNELRHVVINEVTRSVFYAPLYVAISEGFFEEVGMDVEIMTGGGSDKSMTALLAGEADFALMGPETGIYVTNQGKQDHPMVVAQLTKRDGCFLVGRTPELDFSWDNVLGKSIIGGRPGGMPLMTLEYVLAQNGIDTTTDVEIINNIQFNLMGSAFEGGTADYVTLFEPTASEFALAGKGHIIVNMGLESGEVPYTAIFADQKTISSEPEFVQSFVQALYKAQLWVMKASDAEIAEAMQPFFPATSLDTLAAVSKSYRATDSWAKDPILTDEAFTRLQDIIDNSGELTKRVPIDELVDNSFAEKAVSELGR